jgi:hypothetical protein
VSSRQNRETGRDGAGEGDDHSAEPALVSVDDSGEGTELTIDGRAVRRRAQGLLEDWERAGHLRQVQSRTRTVTALALGVFVVSALLSGTTTGITATVATVWLTVSGVVATAVGAVALLLRGLRKPRDILDKQGLLAVVGLSLLAVGGTHAGRHPASRAAWRYLVTGPLSSGTRRDSVVTGDFGGYESPSEPVPLRRYVRLAGGLSAAVVVLHQGWLVFQGRDTVLSSLVRSLAGQAPGTTSRAGGGGVWAQLTGVETLAVLLGVAVIGAVVGALMAVSRR